VTGRVEGKVALITGAARGQGRSHALRLAEEGADIIALDIARDIKTVAPLYAGATEADLAQTVQSVRDLGRNIVAAHVDVRDRPALRTAVDEGVDKLGRLDIVVANAGVFLPGRAEDIPEDVWDDIVGINLTGVWHTCVVALPHLRAVDSGAIVIISSVAGLKASANSAAYTASKHGVVGLMRALAKELAPERIRVNTVHPSTVDTPMVDNQGMFQMFLPEHRGTITRQEVAPVLQTHNALPVPWVEAVDVSNAVLYLVSDEGRYVTGVALPVDAGCLIR
jgi:SDR family mycofactocin-dependent oxidoreductase